MKHIAFKLDEFPSTSNKLVEILGYTTTPVNIEYAVTLSSDCTWMEIAEHFMNFLYAQGYVLDRGALDAYITESDNDDGFKRPTTSPCDGCQCSQSQPADYAE